MSMMSKRTFVSNAFCMFIHINGADGENEKKLAMFKSLYQFPARPEVRYGHPHHTCIYAAYKIRFSIQFCSFIMCLLLLSTRYIQV